MKRPALFFNKESNWEAVYRTTGDNHSPTIPQDTNSLGSCVIRVDRDGEAAPGNQMPASADSRIFTYGHRNVQVRIHSTPVANNRS